MSKVYVFLKRDCELIKSIERNDDDGNPKGSLSMLKEWMFKNVLADYDMEEVIINPLKNIRKIRQVPAHELYNNEFDVNLYDEQKNLVEDVYEAIYALRRLFMGHPLAASVKISEVLLKRKDIVFY